MPEAATHQQPETMGVIYRMPTSELHPHPDNPFGVRDDPEMQELVDSVQKFGVLVPAIARPRPDGGFELISGHRTPAYQIATLPPREQALLFETIESEQATPSLSQAQRMKKLSQLGGLNEDSVNHHLHCRFPLGTA